MSKRSLSGIKPTGRPHIGNYFGAIRQFVDHQDSHENFVFVANYHALTTETNAEKLHENTLHVVKTYLACGLDPQKTTLFLQSAVPLVNELTWVLNCLMSMSQLQRAHAFKDAIDAGKTINVGLFDYPVLMAADILMYGSDVVPVGRDQKQHVEYARDLAEKYNRTYGDLFTVPESIILEEVEIIPGTDGRKMSKSYNNTIDLFEEPAALKKKVMGITTDSKEVDEPKNPDECNVFTYHKLFATEEELVDLRAQYEAGGFGYGDSKKLLLERMENFIAPLRERYNEITDDEVMEVLEEGGARARVLSEEVMEKVRRATGLVL